MAILESERICDPKTVPVSSDTEGLWFEQNGSRSRIDQIVLCFPNSTPDRWVSLRDSDGEELGLLPSLEGLDDKIRSQIESNLKDRYHIPTITRVVSVESVAGGTRWQVETPDGQEQFQILSERGFNMNGFPHILFTDGMTQNRYQIMDYTSLDRPSQKLLRTRLNIGRHHGHHGRGPGPGRGRGR